MTDPTGLPRAPRPLRATYRLQLHAGFGFEAARAVVPYLARLGVSHLYLSPVFAARPGSTHGYDVVDPRIANPELGGDAAFRALAVEAQAHGLGLLLDVVPNHMGVGAANPFWDDVLRWGEASAYASFFDIDWDANDGRVLLPLLGGPLDDILARDELEVRLVDGEPRVAYWDHVFPIDPRTVHRLFAFTHDWRYPDDAPAAVDEMLRVRDALSAEGGATLSRPDAERALAELKALVARSAAQRAYVEHALAAFSAGEDGRFRLRALLDLQAYELADWRRSARDVNYRRFFDVDDLIALRADDPQVFEATHARVLEWVADGLVDGLRIDHVDGLRDPLGYLQRLRGALDARGRGEPPPLFVEKILSPGEHLRVDWPVDGTTGYEFMNDVEAALVDGRGASVLEDAYRRLLRIKRSGAEFHEVASRGKELVLRRVFVADVRRVVRALAPAARAAGVRATRATLQEAVLQLAAALPVYRTYVDARGPMGGAHASAEDRAMVAAALRRSLGRGGGEPDALRFVASALLGGHAVGQGLAPALPASLSRAVLLEVALRFQQISGPATAKGVEDTALYRYVPLASLNEVGGEPLSARAPAGSDAPATPEDHVARLHQANAERARRWPRALVAVTTHDTKRSADVRARLDALSEMPVAWDAAVAKWRRLAAPLRVRVGGRAAPDPHTEWLLFQTVVGVWPVCDDGTPAAVDGTALDEAFVARVEAYALKAMREAKARTSWTEPDPAYEEVVVAWVRRILGGPGFTIARAELASFVARVARAGWWNGLARTVIQLAGPGTADVYQGDELWSLALVDPDNRRPVDYEARAPRRPPSRRATRRAGARGPRSPPVGDCPDRRGRATRARRPDTRRPCPGRRAG